MRHVLFAAVVLTTLTIAFACAPEFQVAVFTFQRHPDFPRTAYLDGRLGILQPTYARSYLVIAYRYLSKKALNAREKEQVKEYWKDRDTADWDNIGSDSHRLWVAARNRIAPQKIKAKESISQSDGYNITNHEFYMNCAEDAYRTATRTLQDRAARFGAKSRAVQEWLTAQDTVFSNCDAKTPKIPSPAATDLPAIIRADRAYQIAAAHFYAGQEQPAIDGFRQIAADRGSPWREIAPYLVVRTMLRQRATYKSPGAIKDEGRRILADPAHASIRGMTRVLLWRAEMLIGDNDYFFGLARDLSTPGQDLAMREELWGFTTMYDENVGENLWGDEKKQWHTDVSTMRGADLIDWIYNFQSENRTEKQHALQCWKKTHSQPWLLAALSHASATDPSIPELLKAAAGVPIDSPAYLTATFHRLRLLNDLSHAADVRAELDELLSGKVVPLPKSAVNELRGLRMLSSGSLPDYLRFAQRFPLLITWTDDQAEVANRFAWQDNLPKSDVKLPRLDTDSIKILNERTPLRLLLAAAGDPELPENWRRQFALTTLTRALLLNDDHAIQDASALLAPRLHEGVPKVPETTDLPGAISNAADAEARRFAAVFLVLHYPESRPYLDSGLGRQEDNGRIDNYHENWWRRLDSDVELDTHTNWAPSEKRSDADRAAARAAFLSDEDRSLAREEFGRMVETRSATNFLTSQVLTHADAHPDDPRLAEALYLAIRVARFGTSDPDSWKATKTAFQLLHRRYPNAVWAKKTPVWFRQGYFGSEYE